MTRKTNKDITGFSLIELLISMTVMLMLLGIVSSVLYRAVGIRTRESRRTDALTSAQAALNLMSREIANSGFGIYDDSLTKNSNNGIIESDTDGAQIHFRTHINNTGPGPINPTCPTICTNQPGEDVTYFWDAPTSSIVRYDPNADPQTSVVVNKISQVSFVYYNYDPTTGAVTTGPPTNSTGRIQLTVDVTLDPVSGEPNAPYSSVKFTSEINLRNSNYMLHQY